MTRTDGRRRLENRLTLIGFSMCGRTNSVLVEAKTDARGETGETRGRGKVRQGGGTRLL